MATSFKTPPSVSVLTLLLLSGTITAQFQQFNPLRNSIDPWVKKSPYSWTWRTAGPRSGTTKDPWPKSTIDPRAGTTRDPWTGTTRDPWIGTTIDPRAGTTKDPWTGTTRDPWIGTTIDPRAGTTVDPWTRSTIDPRAGTTVDPWTRSTIDPRAGTTVDPWTRSTIDPRAGTTSRTGTADPWPSTRPATPDYETINAINVISSNYFNNRNNNNNNHYSNNNNNNHYSNNNNHYSNTGGTTGNQGNTGTQGSTARCQEAMNECSVLGVDPSALDNVYQQAFATMLLKQRLRYQASLKTARDLFINVLNDLIVNPDVALDSAACSAALSSPVTLLNDPAKDLPDPDSIPDVTIPPVVDCEVTQWSAWSVPLGFGVVERNRTILRTGQCCPDDLVQQVDISTYLEQNTSAFENPNNVAENFDQDFLNNVPRDILLVIDTSSSIFYQDFEVMKEGINTMIDLFCGSFGFGANNNRLAILQYSTKPVLIHTFTDPQDPKTLKQVVSKMADFGGRTCTGDALLEAYRTVFAPTSGSQSNRPKETLVITDGHANCGADIVQSARTLQQRSKSIYALGIGIASDVAARNQVTSLVTNEDVHHIFSLARYVDFKDMIDYIKFYQRGQQCTPIITKTGNNGRK